LDRPTSWNLRPILLASEAAFRLGGALVDPAAHEVVIGDHRERLQPQVMKVLVALHRRMGTVVSRDQLVDWCWDGRIVGEDVVNRCVSLLRRLAERSGGFTIETVPKAGYRLADQSARPRGRRWAEIGVVLSVAGMAAAALLLPGERNERSKPPLPAIALGEFESAPGDPFVHNLARETRNALAHMLSDSGVPVRKVTSQRDPQKGVDFVLYGDVRRLPGTIEVTLRLEQARDRSLLLSKQFTAPVASAESLPERVGASFASSLTWPGALMVLDRRHPPSREITSALLKQLFLDQKEGGPLRGYEIARQVAPKAPDSPSAQLFLAFGAGFVLDELPREQRLAALVRGRLAAERALQLAPDFGDAHIPWCMLHSPYLLIECEKRLRLGMTADANAPFVTLFLSKLLADVGRNDESLALARLSLANDRYQTPKLARLSHALELAGQTREAERLFLDATRWWPDEQVPYFSRAAGILERGDFVALDRFVSTVKNREFIDPGFAKTLANALHSGDRRRVREICHGRVANLEPAMCLIGLARVGETDSAFAIALRTYPSLAARTPAEQDRIWLEHRRAPPLSILSSPAAAPLRRDRRFLALAEGVGLARYWRTGNLPDFCRAPAEPVCAVWRR